MKLKASQIEQYRRDGYLCPLPALTPDEAKHYLYEANDLQARLGEKARPIDMSQAHLHFGWAYDLVIHPVVLDAVEGVLGPNLIVWSSSLFPKKPHDPGYVSWHQDGTYWGLDSDEVATAWVALSNSTVENGCMRVISGSHRMTYQPHEDTHHPDNLLSRGQELNVDVEETAAVDLALTAGQMSLHDVRMIHGSNPNRSDEKRVGFAIRYVTPNVSQTGHRSQAVLARGRDTGSHFELVDRPVDTVVDDALAAMCQTVQQYAAGVSDTRCS